MTEDINDIEVIMVCRICGESEDLHYINGPSKCPTKEELEVYQNNKTQANRRNHCSECGKEIITQIYKGTGVCGENCRKERDNDKKPWRMGDTI